MINSSKTTELKTQSKTNYGLEDLFVGSPVVPSISEKPQKDVNSDIMNLFEKVNLANFHVEIRPCGVLVFFFNNFSP